MNDTIRTPGKFQGCPTYVEYLWNLGLNGEADADDGETFTFEIDASDVERFPSLFGVKTVRIWTDDNGFVHFRAVNGRAVA